MNGLDWTSPFVRTSPPGNHPLTATYSLLLATFLGAIGLPHLLLHSSTFRDGRAARRTTAFALVLVGIFFLFPTVFAVVGRVGAPGLYVTGQADATVVALPRMVFNDAGGAWLAALTTVGAFSALLCAGIGLLSGVAGTLSTALFSGGVSGFRRSAWLAGLVAALLALTTTGVPLAVLAGWAFALAASTLCPLLLLGVWWRRLTWPGAVAGVGVGGVAVLGAVVAHLVGVGDSGWPGVLLALPAVWTVPLGFAAMLLASVLSPSSAPADVTGALLRMHLPEDLARATGRFGVRRAAARGTID
jgi:Na+(H+)/acetate symporter ActP